MDVSYRAAPPNRQPVVILEDDPGVRRSLQLLLCAQGYDVSAYADSPSLLDRADMNAACLIADYRLNETDGISVLSTLRQRGWKGSAILITAFSSEALMNRAKLAGFDRVLEKPLKPHALLSIVQELVPLV
jgi:FixJ family two-component response regulator